MITQQQRARALRIVARREALVTEIELRDQEIGQIIQSARAGLTSIPVPGEAWDGGKNYIVGDAAMDGGIIYEATYYSKNRRPSESPEHWKIPEAPSLPDWYAIADGTIIYEDDEVTCDGKNWRCKQQHMKSTVYKPKAGSSRWEAI